MTARPKEGAPDVELVFDGGSRGNPGWGYGSYALISQEIWGDKGAHIHRLEFGDGVTNNQAEYDTLIAALEALLNEVNRLGRDPRSFSLEIRGDSTLVIRQVQGVWKVRKETLRPRCRRVQELLSHFGQARLQCQPRSKSVALLGH